MTDAEVAHFHSKRINVAQLCDKFGPIVKSYAKTGTRKPRDVAPRGSMQRGRAYVTRQASRPVTSPSRIIWSHRPEGIRVCERGSIPSVHKNAMRALGPPIFGDNHLLSGAACAGAAMQAVPD
ncbi:hypothetical protein [Mesorhizobium sp. M0859]|uniref:hypothetical protein n=1 Tax=Mesorhizobium sp. M0859 TaxID=2957014 RepID=UPI00333CFF8D